MFNTGGFAFLIPKGVKRINVNHPRYTTSPNDTMVSAKSAATPSRTATGQLAPRA